MIEVPNSRCEECGKPMHTESYGSTCCDRICMEKNSEKKYLVDKISKEEGVYNFEDIFNLTHDGVYILGLIFSTGSIKGNTITIVQNERPYERSSGNLIEKLSEKLVGNHTLVRSINRGVLYLESKELVKFVKSLGVIAKDKKNSTLDMSKIPEDKLASFSCGYFDGVGEFKYDYRRPEIFLKSNSEKILNTIAKIWGVGVVDGNTIHTSGNKVLDICGKMYKDVSFRHTKKYEYFMDILNWDPNPSGRWYSDITFKYKKLSKEAIPPFKSRVTDSGYDIFAVDITYDEKTDLYTADTKLAIEPIPGWYFDMLGRSSLPKTGYMFVGGVGVIDKSYTGPLKMLLKKINKEAPKPDVPFKMGQIIPRRIIHADFTEVDQLSDTDRGSGGFGSTGK